MEVICCLAFNESLVGRDQAGHSLPLNGSWLPSSGQWGDSDTYWLPTQIQGVVVMVRMGRCV